jgi:hypothetical protein
LRYYPCFRRACLEQLQFWPEESHSKISWGRIVSAAMKIRYRPTPDEVFAEQ